VIVIVDVAVVGGGPAGIAAALAARRAGASVALIDEYAAPGGQIWRRSLSGALPRAGRDACAALDASGATVLTGTAVWAAPDPRTLLVAGPDGAPGRVRAGAIVLATGAYDRPLAFPGWTLPGVMTAGAAQALAKGQGVPPGRRVLLAGAGPFLLPVARQLTQVGASVVAVVEATRRAEWLAAAPRMARHPRRLGAYAGYRARLLGTRFVWGHVLVRAEGAGAVERATIARCGPDWAPAGDERSFAVDAVCTAYGFLPSIELARALGCELRGDAVAHDANMRTSVERVLVAGEAAGVGGADLARLEGELAGARAAEAALARPPRDLASLQRRRARAADFAALLDDLFRSRPGLGTLPAPDTILCRCEDVTAGEIDAAGADSPAALKILTRCGQGPCQGRVCERMIAERLGAAAGFSARPPLRPVPLSVLIRSSPS
jgi:NADPH-dependent 2,4-dienoyl-CoA reductase/sulfur reductase-like enzyme